MDKSTRIVQDVIGVVVDWYHDMDDSDDGHFGEYARTTVEGNSVIVRHQTEDQPCVRITVEMAQ